MWIIVKRAAMFLEDEYATNANGETVQVITNQMTVYPVQGDIPQEIPAWAEDDELCQLGIKEGWLIETSQQSAQAAIARAEKGPNQVEEKVPVGMTPGSQGGQWGKKVK